MGYLDELDPKVLLEPEVPFASSHPYRAAALVVAQPKPSEMAVRQACNRSFGACRRDDPLVFHL
jgi:hypothetical protein